MTKAQFKTLQHHYKRFRKHQMDVANDGGGCLTTYPEGRTELSYASAPYGEHAYSAFMSARRHIHFMSVHGMKA